MKARKDGLEENLIVIGFIALLTECEVQMRCSWGLCQGCLNRAKLNVSPSLKKLNKIT